jgi:hypothetical protein
MNGFDMTIFHLIFFTLFFCESTESQKSKRKVSPFDWYFINAHCGLYWSLYIFYCLRLGKVLCQKNRQFTISMRIHEISHKIWYNHVKRQKNPIAHLVFLYSYCHILIICQIREIWSKRSEKKYDTTHTNKNQHNADFLWSSTQLLISFNRQWAHTPNICLPQACFELCVFWQHYSGLITFRIYKK